jgi:hypothetical protein
VGRPDRRARLAALGLATLWTIAAADARADEPWGTSHWEARWPRFHWGEAVAAVAAEGVAVAIYAIEPRHDAGWTDPAPLDGELRDGLRLEGHDERHSAMVASDVLFVSLLTVPVVIDAFLLAGLVHGDSDTMLQMLLIDMEAYAFAHLVTWLTSRLSGRVRPNHRECVATDTCTDRGVGPIASFVSGHALMAYTASGLVCVHHIANPWLAGGREGSVLACATSFAAATAIGILRVNADSHWASDVGIAALIGSSIGIGIPLFFHYARPRHHRATRGATPMIAAVPAAGGGPGLGIFGRF